MLTIFEMVEQLSEVASYGDDRLSAWEYDSIESIEELIETREVASKQRDKIEELWMKFCN